MQRYNGNGNSNSRPWRLVYDGEEEQTEQTEQTQEEVKDEDAKVEVEDKKSTDNKNKVETKPRVYTQDQLNKALAEDRRKNQRNRDQMLSELKGLRDSVQLTEAQREQLENRIEQLQNETLTAQEVGKRERDRLIKQHSEELRKANEKAEKIWGRYAAEKITREITDAALENEAVSAIQIVNILQQNTKLVEELKDGQPTGNWVTRVSFQDKDAKGEPITLELSVTEAVKRMKEIPEHWNLFRSGANGGLGGYNTPQAAARKGTKPPANPVEYRKWRKANIGENSNA